MAKSIFIAGTGTDVGKTYISALVVKCLRNAGLNAGYYKAAVSGVELDTNGRLIGGDPIYVNETANIGERAENLVSYVYSEAVSPHLAARIDNRPIDINVIDRDYKKAYAKYDFIVFEGSGGVICPLRWDNDVHMTTLDIVRRFDLPIMLVADAGLGTINATVLTVEYLRTHNFNVNSIIINRFTNKADQTDNVEMIKQMTKLPIIATVEISAEALDINTDTLTKLFK